MTTTAFLRRAAHWVVLSGLSYTIVDWFRQRPDREPNFLLWAGLSIWAAEVTGATWPRWRAVVAAEATGAAYVVLVVALQAVLSLAGGAGPWHPSLSTLAIQVGVIAPVAYFQARSARRRADKTAIEGAAQPGPAKSAG